MKRYHNPYLDLLGLQRERYFRPMDVGRAVLKVGSYLFSMLK